MFVAFKWNCKTVFKKRHQLQIHGNFVNSIFSLVRLVSKCVRILKEIFLTSETFSSATQIESNSWIYDFGICCRFFIRNFHKLKSISIAKLCVCVYVYVSALCMYVFFFFLRKNKLFFFIMFIVYWFSNWISCLVIEILMAVQTKIKRAKNTSSHHYHCIFNSN